VKWITGAKARASLCAGAKAKAKRSKRSGSAPPSATPTPAPTPMMIPAQTPSIMPPPLDVNTDAEVQGRKSESYVPRPKALSALPSWRPFSPADDVRHSEGGDNIDHDTHEFEVDPSVWDEDIDLLIDADSVTTSANLDTNQKVDAGKRASGSVGDLHGAATDAGQEVRVQTHIRDQAHPQTSTGADAG